jgi:hypothetical protein
VRHICYTLATLSFPTPHVWLCYTFLSHALTKSFANQKCATFATLWLHSPFPHSCYTFGSPKMRHICYTFPTLCFPTPHVHFCYTFFLTLSLHHFLIKNVPHLLHFSYTCLPHFGYTFPRLFPDFDHTIC